MKKVLDPFRFLLTAVAGWMNQAQQQMVEYLREENRVLREQLGDRRLRLNDHQRRRLAAKAKSLGRKRLAQVAGIVTHGTLLAWHRKLIAQKYDGAAERPKVPPGRAIFGHGCVPHPVRAPDAEERIHRALHALQVQLILLMFVERRDLQSDHGARCPSRARLRALPLSARRSAAPPPAARRPA